jgi:hypothetical protein
MQVGRLRDLYMFGDIDKARYLSERERLKRELAVLDASTHDEISRLGALADLLANVADAWAVARPEQRNRLARLLFDEVVINDERVAAVKPRPELAGFFLLDFEKRAGLSHEYRTSGPDGRRAISRYSRVTACSSAPIVSLSMHTGRQYGPPGWRGEVHQARDPRRPHRRQGPITAGVPE